MYRCKACNSLMKEEEAKDDIIGWEEYDPLCTRCLGSISDYDDRHMSYDSISDDEDLDYDY